MSAKPPPEEPTALVRQQTAAVVTAASPAMMEEAITAYVQLQQTLDRALPNCIMTIQGRQFRKKNYWRAVTTAFNLTVEAVDERWEQFDGDWCCDVTYRATAPNGRAAFGDGSCSFREKRGAQGTRHNVRSHAHTRAYNRAVSNLVGFGEVSAEEVERDHAPEPESRHQEPPRRELEPVSADEFRAYWMVRLREIDEGISDEDRHKVQAGLFGKAHLADLTDEERARCKQRLTRTTPDQLRAAIEKHYSPIPF